MEAEVAQARVAVAQAESMYKSERAQWVTSLDAQKFEVGGVVRCWPCSELLTSFASGTRQLHLHPSHPCSKAPSASLSGGTQLGDCCALSMAVRLAAGGAPAA